jgi:hypothetical protein
MGFQHVAHVPPATLATLKWSGRSVERLLPARRRVRADEFASAAVAVPDDLPAVAVAGAVNAP